MICFEITINGEKICTAGIEQEYGVISSILTWVKRKKAPAETCSEVSEEELFLDVGGLITHGNNNHENLKWLKREIEAGDEITIRVIESDSCTQSSSRTKQDPDFLEKEKRKYYKKLKKEYENDKDV